MAREEQNLKEAKRLFFSVTNVRVNSYWYQPSFNYINIAIDHSVSLTTKEGKDSRCIIERSVRYHGTEVFLKGLDRPLR
jgi:hypothetical protein